MEAVLGELLATFSREHPYIAALVFAWTMLDVVTAAVRKTVTFVRSLRRECRRMLAPVK